MTVEILTVRPLWSFLSFDRVFRTTGAKSNFGFFRQPELTARFELGVWLFVRQTDSVSLLLGRWPLMLGTNPVSYIPFVFINSFVFLGEFSRLREGRL